jgi:hypothetical protein
MMQASSSLKKIQSTELVHWSIAPLPQRETLQVEVDSNLPCLSYFGLLNALSPNSVNATFTKLVIDVEVAVLLSNLSIRGLYSPEVEGR